MGFDKTRYYNAKYYPGRLVRLAMILADYGIVIRLRREEIVSLDMLDIRYYLAVHWHVQDSLPDQTRYNLSVPKMLRHAENVHRLVRTYYSEEYHSGDS